MGQIEDMRLFVTVVEEKSISKAANVLNIAKSAVSRRLSLLEDRLDTQLIDRRPGTWEVTAIGKDLYQRVGTLLGELDELESDFIPQNTNKIKNLSISIPHEFGNRHLLPLLIEFQKQHDNIKLHVAFEDRKVDLALENYDFAIRLTTNEKQDGIVHKLGCFQFGIYASPKYLEKHGVPNSMTDLDQHQILHYGPEKRAIWPYYCKGKLKEYQVITNISSNYGRYLYEACENAIGIARMPSFILSENHGLTQLFTDISMPPLHIFLLQHTTRRHNIATRTFIETIKNYCHSEFQ